MSEKIELFSSVVIQSKNTKKRKCDVDLTNSKTPIPMDSKIQKLVILFVFEKMAIPLTEATVLDVCSSENDWLSYMECKQYLSELASTFTISV